MEDDAVKEDFDVDIEEQEIDFDFVPEYEINIAIPEEQHITSDEITIHELAELLSIRIGQIQKGSPIFTDITDYHDAMSIAWKELADRRLPLKIARYIYSKDNKHYYEYKDPKNIRIKIPNIGLIKPSINEIRKKINELS
jgi:DNA-directed RNA polymerase subunit K/omega